MGPASSPAFILEPGIKPGGISFQHYAVHSEPGSIAFKPCKSPAGPDFGPGAGPAGSTLTSLNRTSGKGRTQSLSLKDRAGTGHEAKIRHIRHVRTG